jgi:hypothetical protein
MKSLFEVINKYLGQSYTRVYVWAETEDQAIEMATQSIKKEAEQFPYYEYDYWTDLSIAKLFDADAEPFVTLPSGDGWREKPTHEHRKIT